MGIYTVKMPDVGEGIAEAEIVEFNNAIGGMIQEDEVIAAVMTDKATVEIPSSVSGKILWYAGEIGDIISVGAPLMRIEVEGEGNEDNFDNGSSFEEVENKQDQAEIAPIAGTSAAKELDPEPKLEQREVTPATASAAIPVTAPVRRGEGEKPMASPAVRKRAKDAGVDLRLISGSGVVGQITHNDLDLYFSNDEQSAPMSKAFKAKNLDVLDIKVVGMRRKIAERMTEAKRTIPHISVIEEIDVTSLEELREKLNNERGDKPKLTILPFLMGAMVVALKEQPNLNSNYDDENNIVHQIGAAHIGIATQTDKGLMVPVINHCEALTIWQMADELLRVAQAAREGTASREALSGSTISITSLGKLGAIATTPIINKPEVAIVGVNRMAIRPMWNGTEFVPRKMMNISCSFDHRIIDGWDAAVFVQRLKTLLETPAMIFVEG